MIDSGGGSIVNVHSVEGMRGYPGRAGVRRDEGRGRALHHVSRRRAGSQRHPRQRHRSRPHADRRRSTTAPVSEHDDMWESWAPVGRLGWPEDQARVALFLASDMSALRHRAQHPGRRRHQDRRRLVLVAVGAALHQPPDHALSPVVGSRSRDALRRGRRVHAEHAEGRHMAAAVILEFDGVTEKEYRGGQRPRSASIPTHRRAATGPTGLGQPLRSGST